MTRRKGELTLDKIRRGWPHSVVVAREVFDARVNLQAAYPTMAPRHETIHKNGRDYLRVFFTDLVEAELFRERAAGWVDLEDVA